jgi:hypothetical protein
MRALPLALLLAAGLAACSGPALDAAEPGAALLARHGLAGMSGRELVERLDASPEERPLPFGASVRPEEVLVGDGTTQVAVPLPEDEFYVSIAPYRQHTHECFHHNLATCRGEMAHRDVTVTFRDAGGTVILEEAATTQANGFVGFWLPRDVTGTVTVTTDDGYAGTVPFGTGQDDPTCITTLQLEPAR